jgi:hypothetical protein
MDVITRSRGGTAAPKEATIPRNVRRAVSPPLPDPVFRPLRTFAFDPLLGTRIETVGMNEAIVNVRWENLEPGPIGEYIEVVDIDPASNAAYAPVNLDHPSLLAQSGLAPSEANPQFHQQMVYAVAMKTIANFERALGRVAMWSPYEFTDKKGYHKHFVRRLRIYPHALREGNAYYSPDKKALLFGYFPASSTEAGDNLPGGRVFCCLSHDVVAHETTHALLDGMHRRYREPTNPDMPAFHEAFADIVALFEHFAMPEALHDQIARTQGDLGRQNLLGQLALQFGEAIGQYGALRSAIGKEIKKDGKTEWVPVEPHVTDYERSTEPHARGAVLVAAVFDAFLAIYKRRSEDLIRLATGGTGVLPPGAIPHDLVHRLSHEAAKTASHILGICIRALDYCPPVDLTFGEYARAMITADRDLVPDDPWGYRPALIQGFRSRGIYPQNVNSLSVESLCWEHPDVDLNMKSLLDSLSLRWDLHVERERAYEISHSNGAKVHAWLADPKNLSDEEAMKLGYYRRLSLPGEAGKTGELRPFEVHSVRPIRRVGPDGQQITELTVEITQSWYPNNRSLPRVRGGSTLLIDMERDDIRYCIRKSLANVERIKAQHAYLRQRTDASLRAAYTDDSVSREPFAMMHRGVG